MNQKLKTLIKMTAGGALLGLTLAGCAVGPDYKAPEDNLAPFHNQGDGGNGQAPSLDTWWTGFNDPQLVTVEQKALSQNLDLAASFARVSQARAATSGAKAALMPTVDMNAGEAYEHNSLYSPFGSVSKGAPGFQRDAHETTIGPSASWELDIFGGLRRGVGAAKDELQAAEADNAGTRVTVTADAADAYFQIRGYQARLAVAEKQVQTDANLVDLVQKRHNAGAATDREIAQATALLKNARASVPTLRFGLEQQLNRLDVLVGVQPGTFARQLAAGTDVPSIPAIPGKETPVDVLRRRPDVIAAERRLAASNEVIGQNIASYYPKVSLSGLLGLDSLSDGHLFTGNALGAIGEGAVKWRIFDFGKIDAEVAQAKGANAEALAVYRQTVLRAAEDVEDALAGLSQTQAHTVEVQGEVDALTKARDLAQEAYKAGSITLTDVLDADRQLLAAQDDLDASRANAARAAVGVFRAFGGGWNPQGNIAVQDGAAPAATAAAKN